MGILRLEKDPFENHNAYSDMEYASIIKEMKEELARLRVSVGDTDEEPTPMGRREGPGWHSPLFQISM